MRYAILLLAFIALSVYAAETKSDRDVAECNKVAATKIAKAKLKHPLEAEEIRKTEVNACMAALAHPGAKIRAK